MTGRRGGNRIRGPQSALTDFLAANNISAAQIRDEYQRRRRRHDSPANGEGPSAAPEQNGEDQEEVEEVLQAEAVDAAIETSKRKRKRNEEKAIEKIKKAKKAKEAKKHKQKGKKRGSKDFDDESDDNDDLDSDADFMPEMYKKARPAPGQFEHCELCSKRFTVTPYSKEGPDGGLVCTPCGKTLKKDLKAEKKAFEKPVNRKRRKIESDKLDGFAVRGAKTLQQICVEKIVQNHNEIEELGDIPASIVERLSEIFSKKRVLKSKTLPLFLRPELDQVILHDAAYLEVDDYKHIAAVQPNLRRLVLGNACQMKDEAMSYILERCKELRFVQMYAPNLLSESMWLRFFREAGGKLEALKLKFLDAAFEDATVAEMVKHCRNLRRLKLAFCRRIGEDAVAAISTLTTLEHLSLQMSQPVANSVLVNLVTSLGSNLRTLSLEKFLDADDSVLEAIHRTCRTVAKLRFSENDTATDAAFVALFTEWDNPPLTFVDTSSCRHIDNNNPEGPEDAVGMASAGFKAMMAHSGPALNHLDISSCRHIGLSAFMDVFNGAQTYPALEYINVSFCNRVDTSVVAGIFKSCPALKQLVAFGCFDVADVVVPRDVAMIGVPKAQDALEQFGVGIAVEEAIERMVGIAA